MRIFCDTKIVKLIYLYYNENCVLKKKAGRNFTILHTANFAQHDNFITTFLFVL